MIEKFPVPGWQQWEGGGGTVECGGVGSEGGVSARGHLAGMRGYLGNELIRWGGVLPLILGQCPVVCHYARTYCGGGHVPQRVSSM